MEIKLGTKAATFIAVLFIVSGWVLLTNLPRHNQGTNATYDRWTQTDYENWQPWTGIVLLSLGSTYFLLRFLPNNPNDSN